MIADLSTYSLRDFLPFSRDTWLRLYELYNADIWPLPIIFTLAGLLMLWHTTRLKTSQHAYFAVLVLIFAWLWAGWQFHWERYAMLNWAATYMAIAFFSQAALLTLLSLVTQQVRFYWQPDFISRSSVAIVLFALVVQPLLGLMFGRDWQQLASFAATPDPTVVASLGLLLLARGGFRWLLLPIPLLWCVISNVTASAMSSLEALPTAIAALLVLLLWGYRLVALDLKGKASL